MHSAGGWRWLFALAVLLAATSVQSQTNLPGETTAPTSPEPPRSYLIVWTGYGYDSPLELNCEDTMVFVWNLTSNSNPEALSNIALADYDSCQEIGQLTPPAKQGDYTIVFFNPGQYHYIATGECDNGRSVKAVVSGPCIDSELKQQALDAAVVARNTTILTSDGSPIVLAPGQAPGPAPQPPPTPTPTFTIPPTPTPTPTFTIPPTPPPGTPAPAPSPSETPPTTPPASTPPPGTPNPGPPPTGPPPTAPPPGTPPPGPPPTQAPPPTPPPSTPPPGTPTPRPTTNPPTTPPPNTPPPTANPPTTPPPKTPPPTTPPTTTPPPEPPLPTTPPPTPPPTTGPPPETPIPPTPQSPAPVPAAEPSSNNVTVVEQKITINVPLEITVSVSIGNPTVVASGNAGEPAEGPSALGPEPGILDNIGPDEQLLFGVENNYGEDESYFYNDDTTIVLPRDTEVLVGRKRRSLLMAQLPFVVVPSHAISDFLTDND